MQSVFQLEETADGQAVAFLLSVFDRSCFIFAWLEVKGELYQLALAIWFDQTAIALVSTRVGPG